MAILVPATSTTAFANASSITITKPTGLAAGNVLFAAIYFSQNSTDTVTTPSDWTQILTINQAASGSHRLTLLYKVADSTDAAASNFTFSFSGTVQSSGALLRITGSAFSSIVQASDSDAIENNAQTFSGGVTQTQASSLIIFVMGLAACQQNGDLSVSVANDNPTWTEVFEDERNLTDTNNYVWNLSYAIRTATGATGNYSFNDGGYINANADSIGAIVCINPAVDLSYSASVITSTGAVQAPAVSGGATVSASVITSSGTVPSLADVGQADWSSVQKSSAPTWNSQAKN